MFLCFSTQSGSRSLFYWIAASLEVSLKRKKIMKKIGFKKKRLNSGAVLRIAAPHQGGGFGIQT